MEESITIFPEIEEGVPLTINGDPPDVEPCVFVKGMYFSVFYCFCYDTDISTDISEEQVVERDIRTSTRWRTLGSTIFGEIIGGI